MSTLCLFYQNEPREVSSNGAPIVTPFVTRWCSMPQNSPVPEGMAKGVIGAERVLRCNGDRRACTVPPRHFHQQIFEELAR